MVQCVKADINIWRNDAERRQKTHNIYNSISYSLGGIAGVTAWRDDKSQKECNFGEELRDG